MASLTPSSRNIVFAISGTIPVLELPRRQALDLLEHLGLGRPEFGAIEVNALLPLCRRRLWPEPRNVVPLQPLVAKVAEAIAASRGQLLYFG